MLLMKFINYICFILNVKLVNLNAIFFVSKIDSPSISYKKESYMIGLATKAGRQAMAMEPPKKGMQNGPYRASKHN